MESIKVIQMNLFTKESHRCRKQTEGSRREKRGKGINWEIGIEIYTLLHIKWASLGGSAVKNLPAMQETWVRSLGWEDSLEEGVATHCSILAGKIAWIEGSGGLQSMES